jgi:hypothetical protein
MHHSWRIFDVRFILPMVVVVPSAMIVVVSFSFVFAQGRNGKMDDQRRKGNKE